MFDLIKKTAALWRKDRGNQLSAALTFYAVFAIAPIIIVVIAVAGIFFGEQAAKGELVGQIHSFVGKEIASAVQVIIENAHVSNSNIIFTVLSVLILLFAASRLISQIKYALNKIWDVDKQNKKGVHHIIKHKFLSFLGIISLGFLFVILLTTSGFLATVWIYLAQFIPLNTNVFQLINIVISIGLTTLIIGLIYKRFPDINLKWKDVWLGALLATLMFMLGNWLIGLYIRNISIDSVYGAAGSFVIIIIWLYYICQIFLFCAMFTKVYASEKGSYKGFLSKLLNRISI